VAGGGPTVSGVGRHITGRGGGRALGVGAKVGGEPTVATDASAGAAAIVGVDR
jgi:hypothetical protein